MTRSDSQEINTLSSSRSSVLAIGTGDLLVLLVAALFESGWSKIHVLITESVSTVRQQMTSLETRARQTDFNATIVEISHQNEKKCWREALTPFLYILYVSQEGDIKQLRTIHAICRAEKKTMFPAICVGQVGLAGPIVHPNTDGCWESAWRRIHRTSLYTNSINCTYTSAAGALLANVVVSDLLKMMTGTFRSELNNTIYLLNLETLEGDRHSFVPHLLELGCMTVEWIHDLDLRLKQDQGRSWQANRLFTYFDQLTSKELGVFHTWGAGELKQLPLSQCRIQVSDPLSVGPAELLTGLVSSHLTHEEAHREAGLQGIEAYASRMTSRFVTTSPLYGDLNGCQVTSREFIGVGGGETVAESICRGLQKCLNDQFSTRRAHEKPLVKPIVFPGMEDKHCSYYLQALISMQGTSPTFGLGEEVYGFPTVWVGLSDSWFGCAGLTITMALSKALQMALQQVQNNDTCLTTLGLNVSSVNQEKRKPISHDLSIHKDSALSEILQDALQILERNRKRLLVFDLAIEPFIKEGPIELFGIILQDEVSK